MKKRLKFFLALILVITAHFMSCNSDDYNKIDLTGHSGAQMRNLLGINAFEWDFLQDPANSSEGSRIFEPKFELFKSFGQFRHYLDWEKLEDKPGKYTFNPTRRGGWNYDVIYERCKAEGIGVVACIKTAPDWLYKSYPVGEQSSDQRPISYGSNPENPKSYLAQAKVAFQYAARYGANKMIDSSLVSVDTTKRWSGDMGNQRKIGLNTVQFIECSNEPEKWTKGEDLAKAAAAYAANLSAFYDGHMGSMGKNVGAKTADSSMLVLMGGLESANINYVKLIVQWCKKNRGLRKDGTINLCFDVVNYHLYANNNDGITQKILGGKRGTAPELASETAVAREFVAYTKNLNKKLQVWVTESGYDIDDKSPQRAIAIGNKSALITQADWTLRSCLLFARNGIDRSFFYVMNDLKPYNNGRFGSSGFVEGMKRRPVAEYFLQVKKLMGDYSYHSTVNNDPFVDIYTLDKKRIYILSVPDQNDRRENYSLELPGVKKVIIHELQPGKLMMGSKIVNVTNGKITLEVTETPIFVEPIFQ